MARVLDSPLAKLRWADKHIDRFKTESDAFINSEPYSFIKEANPNPPEYLIRARINHAVPDHWGLIVGDFAHNVRSALDILVQDISTLRQNGKFRRQLEFPIYTTHKGYSEAGKRKLRGVSMSDMAMIESFQPYKRPRKSEDFLFILQQLNNADKHRRINVVGVVARSQHVTMPLAAPWSVHVRGGGSVSIGNQILLRYKTVNGGLVTDDGAIVAECTIHSDDVNVNSHVEIQIQFDKTVAGIKARKVMETLTGIRDRVEEIIGRFH